MADEKKPLDVHVAELADSVKSLHEKVDLLHKTKLCFECSCGPCAECAICRSCAICHGCSTCRSCIACKTCFECSCGPCRE